MSGLNVPGRQRHRGDTENSPSVSNLVGTWGGPFRDHRQGGRGLFLIEGKAFFVAGRFDTSPGSP